ncbi:MAG: CBS domain-containing protein [Candidatus Gracilibacteria bacterium]|nr:CBS domain-containing protein [Candidatus Gracilibacteria bacterium]MDD2909088.1 CBS domain-containing protein [Candidatus Gracilibacteria bacterium]
MLNISQLELTSTYSGRPEINIIKDFINPSLKEFRQKLEDKSINVFTKKELMRFMVSLETKSQLGILLNLTKELQEKILNKISLIDKLPISTFEKTMQSEDLLIESFNKEDYLTRLNSVKSIERSVPEDQGDITSKKNEYSIIVREVNTVGNALQKMNDNGYNCVFLLGENNKLIGLFSKENLFDKPPFFRLRDIKERLIVVSGNKDITDEDAMITMKTHGVNAIPIIDESGFFYGILSLKFKEKNEIENSAVLELTRLNLSLI